MKPIHCCVPILPMLAGLCFLGAQARAQEVTQSFNLQAGWNSIYFEVRPAENATATIFSNRPVSSVWSRAERTTSADFIQDASEENFNQAGWLGWFHPSRPEAFLGNLFAVHANRAYLIKADASFTLTITGRPSARQPDWVPDKLNLRGFPVDATQAPTFGNFLRHSSAHFDSAQDRLRGVYRLGAGGQWAAVANGDLMRSGEAYWVMCQGASDYAGPLGVTSELGDGLDYGLEVNDLTLELRNRSTTARTATILSLDAPSPLAVREFSPTEGYTWPALASPYLMNVAGGAGADVRLAIQRSGFSSASYGTVLEIRDGAGTRQWVSVSAEKYTAAGAQQTPQGGGPIHAASLDEAREHAGLWVGTATLNGVSEAHSPDPSDPTPTKSELNLRLLVHVDGEGQSRLLKEVTQMWRDGTFTNDIDGSLVVDQPGEYVLLTDDTLIPFFSGSAVRDGTSVGRRISTIGYDFPGTTTNNFVEISGFFTVGQTLAVTLTLPFDHPANPFLHRYHPDHDNLNARFDDAAVESYTTTREIELELLATPPDGPAEADYGYNAVAGNYRETITGIHKNPVRVSGIFRLSRVSLITQLNPSPTP